MVDIATDASVKPASHPKPLRVGLDIGSTTVKAVVLDQSDSLGDTLFSDYRRHHANVRATVAGLLVDIHKKLVDLGRGDEPIRLSITGSGGLALADNLFEHAKKTVCIDHHVSNDAFAELNYIRPEASSTSELVYTLLEDEKISKACAEALYMGIAHDTGVFQYSCTSPETMEAAAQLLRKGIDGSEIIEKTYFEKTYIQNQILGRALLESMLVLEKQVVVSVVSRKEMEFFEAVPSDLEGIVAQLRQTKGVEVAIFLHETDTREYKVSLRSKGKVNVSSIAQYFGGGGHVRAAGVTMKGSAHDVINNLLRQITLQLKEA